MLEGRLLYAIRDKNTFFVAEKLRLFIIRSQSSKNNLRIGFTRVHFSVESFFGHLFPGEIVFCSRKIAFIKYIFFGGARGGNGYRRRILTRRHEFKSWT